MSETSNVIREYALVVLVAGAIVWMGALEIYRRAAAPQDPYLDSSDALILGSIVGGGDALVKRVVSRAGGDEVDELAIARGRVRASLRPGEEPAFLKEKDSREVKSLLGLSSEEEG